MEQTYNTVRKSEAKVGMGTRRNGDRDIYGTETGTDMGTEIGRDL
jgi:hypothetical protein